MRLIHAALALAAAASLGQAAQATNLVTNGGFETLLQPGVSGEFGDRFASQQVVGWSTAGYNWVFTPGSADTACNGGEYGCLQLHGPGNGTANGLPASSPLGGNYLGADGAFTTGAIYQQLSGLTPGKKYNVTFAYAGAQQAGFSGATTEGWVVDLSPNILQDGDRRNNTLPSTAQITGGDIGGNLHNADHGFTGWQTQTFTFTAQTANDFLSFLAIGTPDGVPPFALLDGVTAAAVPEPATWGLMVAGLGLVGVAARRRMTVVAA